jgi:hypothetical protein
MDSDIDINEGLASYPQPNFITLQKPQNSEAMFIAIYNSEPWLLDIYYIR